MSDNQQTSLGLPDERPTNVDEYRFEPIKGYPMLNWRGKRSFTSTRYYPAQLKEVHGPEVDGWRNKIYWGDNLQVMSHLLKNFRGAIKLIYIDPPYDSQTEYKKQIKVSSSQPILGDVSTFEEKQYTDIWVNDEYLQFMYERLIVLKELLSDDGSIYVHCDWRKSHYIRLILDELFGAQNFKNEIIWKRKGGSSNPSSQYDVATDTIFLYGKTNNAFFAPTYSKDTAETREYIEERFNNIDEHKRRFMKSPIVSPNYRENLIYEYKGYSPPPNGWSISKDLMEQWDKAGKLYFPESGERIYRKIYLDEYPGQPVSNLWSDIFVINPMAKERVGYPTQKPETLLERIINTSTLPGDIVLDCFMGSGTTQAVAMKLGRRFLGADINLGAIQITTKRLLGVVHNLPGSSHQTELFTQEDKTAKIFVGFEVYNVNHYDVFRNPLEARELLLEVLEVNKLPQSGLYDGEKDGRMVKLMPVNRIATRADLSELITGFDYKSFEKRQLARPNEPVEKITLVCMGHEPDLKASLEQEAAPYKIDVEVVDILRDRQDLQFKRDSEAQVVIENGQLVIKNFYPMNLLGKLSLQKEKVDNWRELVESVMIDWNFDGAVLQPATVDIPEKNELVKGRYPVPKDAGTIRIKITDLLSESLELEVSHA